MIYKSINKLIAYIKRILEMENKMEEIKFENYFVAFLDVLGFKNMINNNDVTKISIYLNRSQIKINSINSSATKQKIKILVMSDSIVLAIPTGNEGEKIHNLRQLCIAVIALQQYLIESDIFLRGAISEGDLYINLPNNQIVGKALTKAYELESKFAKYPRVILDNEIINSMNYIASQELITAVNQCNNKDAFSYGNEILYDWYKYGNTLEKDMPLFIDYLNSPFKAKFNDVCKSIQTNAANIHVYEKYLWLAKYLTTKACDKSLISELNKV